MTSGWRWAWSWNPDHIYMRGWGTVIMLALIVVMLGGAYAAGRWRGKRASAARRLRAVSESEERDNNW